MADLTESNYNFFQKLIWQLCFDTTNELTFDNVHLKCGFVIGIGIILLFKKLAVRSTEWQRNDNGLFYKFYAYLK